MPPLAPLRFQVGFLPLVIALGPRGGLYAKTMEHTDLRRMVGPLYRVAAAPCLEPPW